jgi:carbamoyl-phosphate synthase large subunit
MVVPASLHLPTVNWKIPGTRTELDFKDLVAIGIGLVVFVLLIVILTLVRRSRRGSAKTLKAMLSSPEASERIAGIDLASTEELGRHVRALRRLSGVEKDPRVLKELAEVVARHQWEPSDDADVVELRIWAHRHYSERAGVSERKVHAPSGPSEPSSGPSEPVSAPSEPPEETRQIEPVLALPVSPPPPSVVLSPIPGVTEPFDEPASPLVPAPTAGIPLSSVDTIASFAEPEAAGAYTVLARWSRPEAGEAVPQAEGEAVPPEEEASEIASVEEPVVPDEEPVVAVEEPIVPDEVPVVAPVVGTPAPFTADLPAILVTGAGGAAAVTVIRTLVAAGHRVVAVDMDPMAVGLRLAHAAEVVPGPDDPQFPDLVSKLAVHQGVKGVISTVAEEILSLAGNRELFDAGQIATWFPDRGVVQACIDKWLFQLAAKTAGLPVPPTNLGSSAGVPGPWIVKPRFGRGSRDILLADTPGDLEWALGHVPAPLVQTRLAGQEFTVDALVARDGSFAGGVPRWRLATRGGITTRGETFTNDGLLRLVENLLRALALRGAANVQGFCSRNGNVMFTEVNPRFSGGLALSLAAGADLVGQFVNGLFELPIELSRLRYRSGVKMLRYFDEVFEG